MLVLSRKLKEKLILPTMNTTIQVVDIKKGVVRLGIDAPPDITVLREELRDRIAEWSAAESHPAAAKGDAGQNHKFRSRLYEELKETGMALGVLRLELDAGLTDEARTTLAYVQDHLQVLLFGVEGEMHEPRPGSPGKRRKLLRTLLVEDDGTQRELLAGFLRQSGLDVDTASDGSDALDYLVSHEKPDVVLLDMAMPRVDGPTVVRKIRGNPAFTGLKIFGVTA